MPNTYSTLGALFTAIANAIRVKKGTVANIVADDFPTEIASIPTGGSPVLQNKTVNVTPTESVQTQTVQADPGYDGLDEVEVNVAAIDDDYVGSNIPRRDSNDLSVSGAIVSAPAGYYENLVSKAVQAMTLPTSASPTPSGASYATINAALAQRYLNIPVGYNDTARVYNLGAMPPGTAGTPVATKGAVSNHSIDVTPSVTNSAGYISSATKMGTAVTVTAAELASGKKEIVNNGDNINVVGYETVKVNVPGGAGKAIQVDSSAASIHVNGYTDTGIGLTVGKTGTYKISWVAWRSSSTGTMGTRLRINSTDGTAHQTWTNTYGQHIELTNQSLTANDVLKIYATSGSTSRYCWVGNLVIEEV